MKKTLWLMMGMVAGLSLVAGGASAGTLGTNITIYDGSGSGSGWYGSQEDREVEPGCLTGQQWDLEAVFLDGDLSLVGGYDFVNGVAGYPGTDAGDLFIDIDGDSVGYVSSYGENVNVPDTFGFDYAVDFDLTTMTYTVYDISGGAVLITCVGEDINDGSNPYAYYNGGSVYATGAIEADDYLTGLADGAAEIAGEGLTGGSHNVLSLDATWLLDICDARSDYEFWTHFTMQCGNDSLDGHNPGVPEPATISLLGLGLLGVVMRKKFWA